MRDLVAAVRALRSELGAIAPSLALAHASTTAGLLTWTRRTLGQAHLVRVAAALAQEWALDIDGLRALGLPVDVLQAFPDWRSGSTSGFTPRRLGLTLSPDAAALPIPALRLQLSPPTGSAPIVLTLVRDLLASLDRSTRIVVLVEPETDAREVDHVAHRLAAHGRRLAFVTVDFGTIFARDNAVAATDSRGRPALVVPRALRTPANSNAEAIDMPAARRSLGVRVVRSRLYWQGGNLVADGETLAIGADTIAENVARLGLSQAEVLQLFVADLGRDVTVLGDARLGRFDATHNRMAATGQASYHVDLDVALLGRTGRRQQPTALIADPAQGLALMASALRSGGLAPARYLGVVATRKDAAREYRAAAHERRPLLAAYRDTLTQRGYRIFGVPDLRTRDKCRGAIGAAGPDIAFCNVLPGLHDGRPAVHYLPSGIRVLDVAAALCYREAGVTPVRVSRTGYLATAMMDRAAGLRCFCGAMP